MFSITPSHIIQYLYCPRFTYYEYVLRVPQYEEKSFKVMQGRTMHENKTVQNKDYLRRRIGVYEKQLNVYLTLDGYPGLRGEVDEVLFLNDGTAAPLDYKFAKWEDRLHASCRLGQPCHLACPLCRSAGEQLVYLFKINPCLFYEHSYWWCNFILYEIIPQVIDEFPVFF